MPREIRHSGREALAVHGLDIKPADRQTDLRSAGKQQDSQDHRRCRHQYCRAASNRPVDERASTRRRGKTQRYAKYPGSSERDTVQEEGIPDAFADELANRPVIGERVTEVAAHHVASPLPELAVERLIESVLFAHPREQVG